MKPRKPRETKRWLIRGDWVVVRDTESWQLGVAKANTSLSELKRFHDWVGRLIKYLETTD